MTELFDTQESEHNVGRKCDVNNTVNAHLYFPLFVIFSYQVQY